MSDWIDHWCSTSRVFTARQMRMRATAA
jgi:hypothetical protein